MKHRDEFQEMIQLYALGVLDGKDLLKFEEHLELGCESCQNSLNEI